MLAYREEERIAAAEKAGARKRAYREERTIYYEGFNGYFAWIIARIPLFKRHDAFDIHLHGYGIPLKLYEVAAYLEELTGERFEAIFGFKAARQDYQYLDDLITLGLQRLGTEVNDVGIDWNNVSRAQSWLAEQIANFKTAHAAAPFMAADASQKAPFALQPNTSSYWPWAPLFGNRISSDRFYQFLEECGLLNSDGSLTPLGKGDELGKARRAPWVGTLQALIAAKILDPNVAAICRALAAPSGRLQVTLAENTLLNPSDKASTYQQVAEGKLRELGLLRN
ncbi:hypothetical protein MON38_10565 [Hymenobacter sp. DH14]|uniref:Uncharacterized protein n=1 Tax=Hymenobacter cyanobacteriorum TaxID=2926463 RepID=A0A9X1VGS5_9BACT|nr:hypothetical protein [Hymenobacter cyanobacteriorum]MCI1187863.1 hypothetical protein [Hymenobacter cyanobacteriorum]